MNVLRRAVPWLLVWVLLGLAPGRAAASPSDKEQAKALFDAGMQAYQRADYASALRTFSAAYATFPSSKLLFNVGQAALNLGRNGEAADAFARFLESEAATADADDKRVAFARKALHELRTKKKVAEVKAHVEPAEAALELDGERLVRPTFFVNRGEPEATHVLRARAPGFADGLVSFAVKGNHADPVELVLARGQAGSAPLATVAPAPVAAPTPAPIATPAPVAADVPRASPAPKPPQAAPGIATRPEPEASAGGGRTAAYATLGAGGGLLVAGAASGAWVAHRAGQISGCAGASIAKCADAGNADAKSLRTKAYVVDALFAGAAVALSAGTVLLFMAPAPGGGGAAGIEGSF